MSMSCLCCFFYCVFFSSSADDTSSSTKVAIKKITDAFDDLIDAKRILREIRILRHFDHENVIGLRDMLNPPLELPFNDM